MLDFFRVSHRNTKAGLEVYPSFVIQSKFNDLMIRGKDFYAVWDENNKMWSESEQTVIDIVDREVERVAQEFDAEKNAGITNEKEKTKIIKRLMSDSDSGMIDKWHKYVQKQLRDQYHQLNEKVIFANSRYNKRDYSSKRLSYSLEEGSIAAYDELMSTLYAPAERDKLEWAIGAVISGDSLKTQKFIFLYGAPGSGKSTFLDIVQWLFEGYYGTIDTAEIGNSSASFSLESLKDNPLVAVQGEANLSRLNDNTKLNSIVSHDVLVVNEKFKGKYSMKFNTFLFLGSNNMVTITDAKSGLTRRVIDVYPTGNLVPYERYVELREIIQNEELGHIAKHCLDRYNELGIGYYSKYVPTRMIEGTNDLYNFMLDIYWRQKAGEWDEEPGLSQKFLWTEYKKYCEEYNVLHPLTFQKMKVELSEYFEEFRDEVYRGGKHGRSVYLGLKKEKFQRSTENSLVAVPNKPKKSWLELKDHSEFKENVFDRIFADCPAQYGDGGGKGGLKYKWDNVKTVLRDLDTTKTHHVRVPETYIHVDFDKKDKDGNKSLELNLEAARDWPPTYAEVSKGGQGLHLTYLYSGDTSKLANVFDEDIEIKVCTGYASLRRRLSLCNDLPIATISSGLPLKGGKKVVNLEAIKNEKILRRFVMNCLEKKHHGSTAPEVDYIYAELEKAYASGLKYDISDLQPSIVAFAAGSSHQAQKCLNTVNKMHFKSDEPSEPDGYSLEDGQEPPIVFFDVEIFPNLFVLCYKFEGEKAVGMINPSGEDIQKLLKYRLVGFNNRKYDNHILYARLQDYNNQQLYNLSQRMINDKVGFFGEAYNLSYTDIYDFASSGNKMSLKKWEIELGIHHQELGLPWDQDVPQELWDKVVEYCLNDVDATEAAFHCDALHADFVAREILADIAGMTPNDTTNSLTTRIIFGNEKNPQKDFVYTDLSTLFPGYEFNPFGIDKERYSGKIVNGKSIYRGIDPSEGGRVYAEPGMYDNVALLDVQSQHPTSIEQLNLFGPYTKRFVDLKTARLYIKHKEFDKAKELFDGKLAKYLDDPDMAKSLSTALKTAINSVYGLTSASFDNKFRDPRNVDNIVAKRGALFMIELQLTLQEMGYPVAHVKTDSIKIPDADQKVIDFVMDFGKKYGYDFEHEATYERMCLVNESTYIARDKEDHHWTATGAQFAVPYVFKTLFSHEPIIFEDLCETKSVTSALYLDFNESLPDVVAAEKELAKWEKDAKASGMTPSEIRDILNNPIPGSEVEALQKDISKGHRYQFVGRVGLFCPMQEGAGGGLLMREKDGKYSAATGTKGYRWMEAEMVRNLGLEDKIDRSYYDALVEEARDTINKFGDFELFVSDEPVPELPF